MSSSPPSQRVWALPLVVGLGLALRLLRAGLRWDEICLAYAAYQQVWVDAPGLGFTGLHPPGYSLIFALLPASPAVWLGFSALCSGGAVWLVGRRFGVGAAAVLAADPLQLAYAAEVNNYPLLVLCIAACLHERGRWWSLALCGALAGWVHALGGLFAGLLLLAGWRDSRRDVLRGLGLMAVLCAPLIWPVLGLSGRESTYEQGGFSLGGLLSGLWEKQEVWVFTLPVALVVGARSRWVLATQSGVILALMALGIADSTQQPYWLSLGPLVACVLGRWAWGLAPLGLLIALPEQVSSARALDANLHRERAVDVAVAQSRPGDAIWLLKPALKTDDDKSAWSDVLWRFSPFALMPVWTGDGETPSFEYADYRYGQPRWMAGRVVHSTTDLDAAVVKELVEAHRAAGRAVYFVLYDHGPAQDYPGLLRRSLEGMNPACETVGEDVGLGVDWVCVVER